MYRAEKLIARVSERLELPAQALGGELQISISADRQVTVEGHRGIRQYSPSRIEVRAGRFCVCVDGAGLQVILMSRASLVIRGTVRAVTLEEPA